MWIYIHIYILYTYSYRYWYTIYTYIQRERERESEHLCAASLGSVTVPCPCRAAVSDLHHHRKRLWTSGWFSKVRITVSSCTGHEVPSVFGRRMGPRFGAWYSGTWKWASSWPMRWWLGNGMACRLHALMLWAVQVWWQAVWVAIAITQHGIEVTLCDRDVNINAVDVREKIVEYRAELEARHGERWPWAKLIGHHFWAKGWACPLQWSGNTAYIKDCGYILRKDCCLGKPGPSWWRMGNAWG